MSWGEVPPNQTLYVNHINEKVKLPELKTCLHQLFCPYGEILAIQAAGSVARKGQAFVVFKDLPAATNALRAMNGFNFFDKKIRVQYAKSKSDVISLEDGTYKPRVTKLTEEQVKAKRKQGPAVVNEAKRKAKEAAAQALAPIEEVKPGQAPPSDAPTQEGTPSKTLFVENLPEEVNEMMLTMLFRQYPGFQEARLIEGRHVAFVEYQDDLQSGIAMHGLQGFMVTPEMSLRISFAKQ